MVAVAIVGSHAPGTARPESDIDVIFIVDDRARFLHNPAWLQHFGHVRSISLEDWGLLQSRRVHYDDETEVEFGITVRGWASTDPVDRGTRETVTQGMRVLYDPETLLKSLLTKVRQSVRSEGSSELD